MSKKYGLILTGSKAAPISPPKADFTKPSIFGSDSDSDEPKKELKKGPSIGPGANEKRLARRIQEKALTEDPTVFQYDELYDEIETKRDEEKKSRTTGERKAKYINRLLETAERRKLENERRLERVVQKEREEEGEEFADKESFVTGSYRKKLEELRKAEEREKREDYLEAIGDVTKQQDLGGFYRHLYEQKLQLKEDQPASRAITNSPESEKTEGKDKVQIKPTTKARAYRKRRSSGEDETETTNEKNVSAKKAHLQSNLDADSDFSIDSSSSSDEEGESIAKVVNAPSVAIKEEPVDETVETTTPPLPSTDSNAETKTNGDCIPVPVKIEDIKQEDDSAAKIEKKVRKDIWKKRTVGEVFEAALQRYYERKAARSG